MNIANVKDKLTDLIGQSIVIQYSLGRNKYEKYQVIIKELYDYVFTVEVDNGSFMEIKSFSYADVITKTIKINVNS